LTTAPSATQPYTLSLHDALPISLLDPDVVFRHDRTAVPAGASREVRGALAVARQFSGRAQGARPALVNGSVGLVVARHGRLSLRSEEHTSELQSLAYLVCRLLLE